MAVCSKCRFVSPEGTVFCQNCGANLMVPPVMQKPTAQPPKTGAIVIAVAIVLVAAVIGVAILMLSQPDQQTPRSGQSTTPQPCQENWICGEWSACYAGQQSKSCSDTNACGTTYLKPATTQSCFSPPPATGGSNATGQQGGTECLQAGFQCSSNSQCCGFCVSGVCKATQNYCGDTHCDSGENCSSCKSDCGECITARELTNNVFTQPLSNSVASDFKNRGYVIVTYLYSPDCDFCYYPTDIQSQLKSLAGLLKDIFVLVIINVDTNPTEAAKYAVANTIYKPYIRVEGISGGSLGYDALYGGALGNKLIDGDVLVDIAPVICNHSDYCDFIDNKVTRVTP